MAYADPQTTHNPTTGQIIPAAWGDIVRDDLEYLARNKPHARVHNNANISIATSGTWQSLTFNTERFDVAAMHSTSTNTGRLTVPSGEGGKYLIGGHVVFATHATGRRLIRILLNGATVIAQHELDNSSSESGGSVSTLYNLAAGDYVELQAFQSSGVALNAIVSANFSPEFWAMWMAT